MSLILKGIDMPKDNDMNITITKDGRIYWDNKYHMIAQAVEISTPHGRIIDDDLLKELIKDSIPTYEIGVKIPTYGDMDIMDKIAAVPTILEAEE